MPLLQQACTPLLALSMPSAAMSDGSRAAAARLVLATIASQPAATQPQSLPWCSAEARHSMVRLRIASVEAHAEAATAAGVHAIAGGKAMSMASAAMSDGSRAAAARVVVATTSLQPAATRFQSLPWCCAEARHSVLSVSKRGSSCSSRYGSSRARHSRRCGVEHARR